MAPFPIPDSIDEKTLMKFADRLREAVADTIESVRVQTLSEEESKALTPAVVSSMLVLCGMDYCEKRGVTPEEYIKGIFAAQSDAIATALAPKK